MEINHHISITGERQNKLKPKLYRVPWVVINGKYNADAEYRLEREICTNIVGEIDTCPDIQQ